MAFMLRAYRVAGKRSMDPKILRKWQNEDEFEFDISTDSGCRHALRSMTINGQPLPRKTKDGEPVAYNIYRMGGQPSYTRIFPGYHPQTGEKLPIYIFGRLDLTPEQVRTQYKEYLDYDRKKQAKIAKEQGE